MKMSTFNKVGRQTAGGTFCGNADSYRKISRQNPIKITPNDI